MTYNPVKPDSGVSPRLDAPIIRTNFSSYGSIFSQNHTPLNSRFQGDHENVIMELQSVDPEVDQDISVLFNNNASSASGTQPQLFSRIKQFLANEIPNNPVQLTYNQVNTSGPQYQSFLPGGYILYVGATTSNTASTVVNLTLVPSALLCVIPSIHNNTGGGQPFGISVNNLSPSGFTLLATGVPPFNMTWIAIGRV